MRSAALPSHRTYPLLGLLAAAITTWGLPALPADRPPPDPANIALGHGIVFGSIEVLWPDQPAMLRYGNSAEKVVQVHAVEKIAQKRAYVTEPDAVIRPRVGENKSFVLDLLVGRYAVTCLYFKDVVGAQPTGYCYPIDAEFTVAPGEITYVGKIVARMPPRIMSLDVDVTVVDDRTAAETKLAPKYGGVFAAATTRLASPPARPDLLMFESSDFPRLGQALADKARVTREADDGAGTSNSRFLVQGPAFEQWEVLVEIVETPRLGNPPTITEWFENFRTQGDTHCTGEWQVLGQGPNDIYFERRTAECAPFPAEHALHRTLYGRNGVWMVICAQRPVLDEQTRRECSALLESAKLGSR